MMKYIFLHKFDSCLALISNSAIRVQSRHKKLNEGLPFHLAATAVNEVGNGRHAALPTPCRMVAPIPRARVDSALIVTFEPVSHQRVSVFPGNGILEAQRQTAKIARSPVAVSVETATWIKITPVGGVFGGYHEICAHAGLRGGPFRTKLGTGVLPFPPRKPATNSALCGGAGPCRSRTIGKTSQDGQHGRAGALVR